MKKFRCTVCGYVYEGDAAPEKCPLCKAPASKFVEVVEVIESKGFCEAVTIRDFPIRDKGVDLIVRRRKWYDKQNNRYFSDSYDLKAEETRYSKEFAAFLKGVYGDDSYDLPFA